MRIEWNLNPRIFVCSSRMQFPISRRLLASIAALAALALLLAAACDDGTVTPPTTNSGIDGFVTIGPTCPVETEESPCPDQPYAATIIIENEDADEVATVESGEDGRFRIDLAPGTYTLVPQVRNDGGPPFAEPVEVVVEAGTYTGVPIVYDSGIR